MRTRASLPLVAALAITAAGCGATRDASVEGGSVAASSTPSAAATAPALAVEESVQAEIDGATVLDVSYASTGGGRVSAWMVVPTGAGPFAGIVYLHGSETDRDDFLDEAIAMASGGAVTLSIDAPFAREGVNRSGTLGNYFDPEAEAALTQQTLDDLERAWELLSQRAEVDPARIGLVGHSWGASLAALLAGTDGPFAATLAITGRPSWTGFLRANADDFAGERSVIGDQGWEAYLDAMEPFDAVPAVSGADPATLYLQFGTTDDVVVAADVDVWVAAAPDGTRIDRYPAGHALDADAVADRAAWLAERLGMADVGGEALAEVGLPDEATLVP